MVNWFYCIAEHVSPLVSTALFSSVLDCGANAGADALTAHTVGDIDPDVPSNIEFLFAFELTQAGAQSFCVNADAP